VTDLVEVRTEEGRPLSVRINTGDVLTHAYFTVQPEQWVKVREAVREALETILTPVGDATGVR
jgi:hypothetical protein